MAGPEVESALSKLLTRRVGWITLLVALGLDQGAKYAAQFTLKPDGWQPGDASPQYEWIDGLVHGTWALGQMVAENASGFQVAWQLGSSLVFFFCIAFFAVVFSRRDAWMMHAGAGLLIAMTVSNLSDVLIFDGVRNFMVLGFDNPLWHGFKDVNDEQTIGVFAQRPQFSPAAVFMWLGLALIVFGAAHDQRKRRRDNKPLPPPPSQPGKRLPPWTPKPGGSAPPAPKK